MAEGSPFRYDRADDSAGFLLWKITALWQQTLGTVLDRFGLTQTQYALMASLRWFEAQEEASTQTHLVDHTKLDKMTSSKAIRRIEESGLVTRARSRADNRAIHVRLTAQGRRVIESAITAIEAADEEFFSSLNARELAQYRRLTAKVIAAAPATSRT